MRRLVAIVVLGCTHPAPRSSLANHAPQTLVELEWRARMDEQDHEWVTLVVDGKPFVVGFAGGPDDDGNTEPEGCTSEPWRRDPAQQVFYCGAAARWYTVAIEHEVLVVTRWDDWIESKRQTHEVVLRLPVHRSQMRVAPYPAT